MLIHNCSYSVIADENIKYHAATDFNYFINIKKTEGLILFLQSTSVGEKETMVNISLMSETGSYIFLLIIMMAADVNIGQKKKIIL